MTIYELSCPSAMEAATYCEFYSSLDAGDELMIGHLTGCMGLICVAPGTKRSALMVHDATSGYPHAKRLLEDFIKRRVATDLSVVWTGHDENQLAWMLRTGVQAQNIVNLPMSVTITYPPQLTDGTAPRELVPGQVISRPAAKFRPVPIHKSQWKKDELAKVCDCCGGAFKKTTFRSGKHHCRNCGNVICDDCSQKHIFSLFGEEERICKDCKPPPVQSSRWC